MTAADQPAADLALIADVRAGLARQADPAKAPAMQAYLKSAMPCLGVVAPVARLSPKAFAAHPLQSFAAWRDTALGLWREARYREERYAAVELTGQPRYRAFQTLAAVPMYEEMIVSGAWWDYVDDIATAAGPDAAVGRRDRPGHARADAGLEPRPDPWKRRTAIICQVGAKKDTDLDLLYACIEPSLPDPGFFLRKGIGWALRSYAWTDPAEVARYVAAHPGELSPLSRREALKHVAPA